MEETKANAGMRYASLAANDGCTLSFQSSLPVPASAPSDPRYRKCIVLMHGFSGSSAYFIRNFNELSRDHWVVAPDMRGHGRSGRSKSGYHVARLAADLKTLVEYLQSMVPEETRFVPVGCSIGAAVLWTYVELFKDGDFSGMVFVDQAPLQDRSWLGDWDQSKAHKGCYDEQTMRQAQQSWVFHSDEAHRGLVEGCLGYLVDPPTDANNWRKPVEERERAEDESFFSGISRLCDQEWLARLLADHTRYDHREACEMISVKTLVMAGVRTGCFPLEGMEETAKRVNAARPGLAKFSVFESGHWLFYEQPKRFHSELVEFVESCTR